MLAKDAKILVADDLTVICQLLKKDLAGLGYTNIVSAADGVKAWECYARAAAEGAPFALVICDMYMPLMNGHELLVRVRNHDKYADTKFFMITGKADKENVIKVARWNVDAYLVKPITANQLKEKISKAFAKSEAA